MIYYELKNYDLLLNKINSVRNYLKKIGHYLPFEKIILKGLNTLVSSSSKQKHLQSLLSELQDNQNNNHLEKYAMQYFDPIKWVKSKINS
jgi:hypothetical protein